MTNDTSFPLPLRGEFVGDGQWELFAPFEYHSETVGVIQIPIGFVTDGASIPKLFHSIIGAPWSGKYPEAALVHDYLYHIKIYSRAESDGIFLEAMKVLGVPYWRRIIMYYCVRLAGWIPWNKRKPLIPTMALLLILAISNISCASLKVEYDKKGRVKEVWSTGLQDTEITQTKDGVKTTVRRKAADIWPSNLFTIYKD